MTIDGTTYTKSIDLVLVFLETPYTAYLKGGDRVIGVPNELTLEGNILDTDLSTGQEDGFTYRTNTYI